MVKQRWIEQKNQQDFTSDLKLISAGKYKSQEQESVLRNIKMLYKAQEKVISFFIMNSIARKK